MGHVRLIRASSSEADHPDARTYWGPRGLEQADVPWWGSPMELSLTGIKSSSIYARTHYGVFPCRLSSVVAFTLPSENSAL
jgi:hypothetical protein